MKPLDKNSVHRICSSQVIVDLTSCVKELLENSLDAQATIVSIRVRELHSQNSVIEVIDNGTGITKENWANVCAKHATSKISSFSDLSKLSTFGFRGEALASLCGMSDDVTIVTRTPDCCIGTILKFDASGELTDSSAVMSRGQGTSVTVTGLFKPLPVRQRELINSAKRQVTAVTAYLQQYAVSAKAVAIEFIVDGKVVLCSSGKYSTSLSAAEVILGLDARRMLEISTTAQCWSFHGWVSQPGYNPPKSAHNVFFNGKPVDTPRRFAKTITTAQKQFSISQAAYLIFLEIEASEIDVNVTPDKRTMLLPVDVESEICQRLNDQMEAVWGIRQIPQISPERQTFIRSTSELKAKMLSESSESSPSDEEPLRSTECAVVPVSFNPVAPQPSSSLPTVQQLKALKSCAVVSEPENRQLLESMSHSSIHSQSSIECAVLSEQQDMAGSPTPLKCAVEKCAVVSGKAPVMAPTDEAPRNFFTKENFRHMEVIGQFNQGFIVGRFAGNLFLVDQHAADEKYRFERLNSSAEITSQPLMQPLRLKLPPAHEQRVCENRAFFKQNGFSAYYDGSADPGSRVSLLSLPTLSGLGVERSGVFDKNDFAELIEQLDDYIVSAKEEHGDVWSATGDVIRPKKIWSHLASKACRTAIMIGDTLTLKDAKRILENLAGLNQPWNCPHGRPTFKHIASMDEVSTAVDTILDSDTISQYLT